MLEQEHDRQAQVEGQAQSEYKDVLAQHRLRVQRAREVCDEARAERRWWAWLRRRIALWNVQSSTPGRPAPARVDANEEGKLKAGLQGEQAVASWLTDALGDEWTLLRGYSNGRGEIDHLLLGPAGLIAIEVKHRNATVYVDGDQWWFEKYDRYDNRVEEGWITDRGGRSPSKQLNDSAGQLEEFLQSRGQPIVIERVVVLTHPRSALGSCEDLTVHITTDVAYVMELANASALALEPARVAKLERMIVRDHAFHEDRRGRRRRGATA